MANLDILCVKDEGFEEREKNGSELTIDTV